MNPGCRSLAFIVMLSVGIAAAARAQPAHPDDVYWVDPFPGVGGPNEYTDTVVPHRDGFLFGGRFSTVSTQQVLYVAQWNGRGWERLGSGVGTTTMGLVHVIRCVGDRVYAGGMFDQVGPWPARNLAQYDHETESWSAVGGGTDRAVRGISIAPNGDLYVVGEFTTAGGVPAQALARFDGQQWHSVGGSLGARARALAVVATDDGVYVGGFFEASGDRPANLARWTGERWESLGSGVNDIVTSITVHNGRVYVGGMFTTAGGISAKRIAVWDGQEWSALGAGVSGTSASTQVRWIDVDIDQVYIAGTFTYAASQPVNYIATWDGTAWHSLGSGASDQVKLVSVQGNDLWAVGNYARIGGKDIAYVAKWTKPGRNRVQFDRLDARRVAGGVHVEWGVTSYGPVADTRLMRRAPGGTYAVVEGAPAGLAGEHVDRDVAVGAAYEYALKVTRENGTEAWSDAARVAVAPATVVLEQNQPNPFNPTTRIVYSLPADRHVVMRVFDAHGGLVRTLVDDIRTAGRNESVWDGRDERGATVASGIYFYRLNVGGEIHTRKMILLK